MSVRAVIYQVPRPFYVGIRAVIGVVIDAATVAKNLVAIAIMTFDPPAATGIDGWDGKEAVFSGMTDPWSCISITFSGESLQE